MQKVSFPILLLLLLSACDGISINSKSQIKWALVDKQKITNALKDDFLSKNPYPKELGDEKGLIEDISRDLCTTSSPKMGKISLYSSSSNSLCPGRT
ncbi:hypothetical protein [Methyloglobulus sp.]|uniref:hypothetical protein n=1 Tax=Methyloglobulus sp. TaxID=2518622 RepID=UPI0032B8026B